MQDMRERFGEALVAVKHINAKVDERFSFRNRAYASLAIQKCIKAINLKKIPSGDWYSPIRKKGILIGYVVGTCNEVSSILHPKMTAKGEIV